MTHTSTEQPSLEAIIHDLRASHAQATAGTWGKGATTHETVSRTEGKQPYKVADFRHSNDAQFCDLAHAFTPRLIAEVESLQKRVQELEAQTAHMADLVELADYATKKLEASQAQRAPLTEDQVRKNKTIRLMNASSGLSIGMLMGLVRAIERAQDEAQGFPQEKQV